MSDPTITLTLTRMEAIALLNCPENGDLEGTQPGDGIPRADTEKPSPWTVAIWKAEEKLSAAVEAIGGRQPEERRTVRRVKL